MQLKIDALDLKILNDLLKDGRKSFADIAKDCGTTKGVIARRFKQMEVKGIIVGATIQNSIECYNKKLIAVIYLMIEEGKTDKVLEFLKGFPQITQIFPSKGGSRIIFWVVLGDTEEFENIRQRLLNAQFVVRLDSQFFFGVRNHPENLSVFGSNPKMKDCNVPALKIKISDIDKQLIEKLAIDGRMTFSQIAKELGATTETISRRYERLKDSGLIRVVIRIDPRKIGYVAFSSFSIKLARADINILNELSEITDITQIQRTSGNFDYWMIVMLRDLESLLAIQDKIRAIQGVAKMESAIMPLFSPWPTFREFKSTE